MARQVTGKQPNSKMCLVCGLRNQFGLHASFYELEDEQVLAVFQPRVEHQGYPERLHGGIASALLDETIGRAIRIRHGDALWGVTTDLHARFRRPVSLSQPVRVLGRITRETRRHFEGSGELLLPDGEVAVEGRGKYLKMPLERISDFDFQQQEWRVVPRANDPTEFEIE
jgi:uncharacterized protein (TIGR00369 family)